MLNLILIVGIIIILGLLVGLGVRKFKFPMVTGYILVGVLLSPDILKYIFGETLVPEDMITGEAGDVLITIALAIIAFMIGGSIRMESLRKQKKIIAWIVPFQALTSWLFVSLIIIFIGPFVIDISNDQILLLAIIIGAISSATAPAATMAIIHEYKAKGPLTTTLLAIVAIDDAVAIIALALALSISAPIMGVELQLFSTVGLAILRIAGAIIVGIIFGYGLIYISKFARTRGLLLVTVLGMILLGAGIAESLDFPLILAIMIMGFVVINTLKRDSLFEVIEGIEDVVFVVFFVFSGMYFNLDVMKTAFLLAILIVIGRCLGKYTGARAGATISKAPETVKKYLGFGLLPKAGVTIGLVLMAANAFPSVGAILVNAVLASVIINELIAPPLTKYALLKAGEAHLK